MSKYRVRLVELEISFFFFFSVSRRQRQPGQRHIKLFIRQRLCESYTSSDGCAKSAGPGKTKLLEAVRFQRRLMLRLIRKFQNFLSLKSLFLL